MSSKTLPVRRTEVGTPPAPTTGLRRFTAPLPTALFAVLAVLGVLSASLAAAVAVVTTTSMLSGALGFAVLVTVGLGAVAAAPVAVRWALLSARDALVTGE